MVQNDQKAGSAVTLFSRGRSHCFESAAPTKSGDLRAYYNWVVFEAGCCGVEGALFSMCAVHTRSVPLQAGCQYVEQSWTALAQGFLVFSFFSQS